MKNFKTLAAALLLVAPILVIVGCDDETHPDPHLKQAAADQRRAMDPNSRQGSPTAAPGTSK